MKNKFLILSVLAYFFISSCVAQCNNKKATSAFEQDLKVVEYLIINPSANRKDIPVIIERIEKVTAIQSESDGNYLGKFHPTKDDLKKWIGWLNINKDKLCWNKKEARYYLAL